MDTYKLAVCEDDEMIRKELCGLCGGILDEEGVCYEITVFSSAAEVEAALYEKGEVYDLLLLDIVMPGMSGMEFAQALRQRRNRTSIIFVTGNEEYLLEGYSVQPVQFLLKPGRRDQDRSGVEPPAEIHGGQDRQQDCEPDACGRRIYREPEPQYYDPPGRDRAFLFLFAWRDRESPAGGTVLSVPQ